MDDSEVKECKELSYNLLQRGHFQVKASNSGFQCPFCPGEDEDDYSHLLQHAIQEAEEGPTGAEKHRPKHASLARYLAVDLANEINAKVSGETSRKRSRSDSSATEFNDATSEAVGTSTTLRQQAMANILNAQKVAMAEKREREALEKVSELGTKMNKMRDEMNGLITKERMSQDELQRVRADLLKEKVLNNKLNAWVNGANSGIGVKKIGEIDANVFKRACKKRFSVEEADMRGVELCSLWHAKLNSSWSPFRFTYDSEGNFYKRAVDEKDASLCRLKAEWGTEAHDAVVTAAKDLRRYQSSGSLKDFELWNFKENRKAKLDEVSSWLRSGRKELLGLKYIVVSVK